MMKKRVMSLSLAAVMTASLLAGCGGGNAGGGSTGSSAAGADGSAAAASGEVDTSKEVNLVMYVVSDRPAGQDVVDESFNKLLKEKMNTTLTVNWIPWADYVNKYPLLFSSGEEFDLAYTANWLNWSQLARKGAFMELDELWPKYAPENFAATTDAAKKQATIDGHLYVVPTQLATYRGYGPTYRTKFDNGKEYTEEITDFASFEKYLDWVKENVPEIRPFEVTAEGTHADDTWLFERGISSAKGATNDILYYDPTQANPKLFTLYEYPDIKKYLETMKRWNEKGFFSKSALSDTDTTQVQNGIAASRVHNIDNYAQYYSIHPEWGFKFADMLKYDFHLPYTQDAMAIAHSSKNPERALMFWNLLTTDREVFDAFYYGILGTTYNLDDKGRFTITDSNMYTVSSMWAARTNEFNRDAAGYPEDYTTIRQEWEKNIAADDTTEKFASFIVDTTAIETEYAACNAVHQQYWWPLELGYTDLESGLAEYKSKMEAAGIEKVCTEIQRQLDEYVAGLGK